MDYITRKIGSVHVIWFQETNQYLMLEEPAYAIWVLNNGGLELNIIADWCSHKYQLPPEKSMSFVKDVIRRSKQMNRCKQHQQDKNTAPFELPSNYYSRKCYLLNNKRFVLYYHDKLLEEMIHPFFSHAETNHVYNAFDYHIFKFEKNYFIHTNDGMLGCWPEQKLNEAIGKLLMNITIKITEVKEDDWAVIFHASAVGNPDNCILFPAKSGKGKSTLAAILQRNNFDVLGDDFIPVYANGFEVYQLPIGLSVKSSALNTLSEYYPELNNTSIHTDPGGKYRLKPDPKHYKENKFYPIKAIVFVNYNKSVPLILKKIPQEYALKKLIPESWISNIPHNVQLFLNWIGKIPCYQMDYSDNKQMIKTIGNLLCSD